MLGLFGAWKTLQDGTGGQTQRQRKDLGVNVNNCFVFLSYSFLSNPVTCLAEGSCEAGGTQAGEVGDLVDALGSVLARLRLTLVHVCRGRKGEPFIVFTSHSVPCIINYHENNLSIGQVGSKLIPLFTASQ